MKIISLVNNKGGSSKSTLSLNLAGVLSKEGRVLFIDLDPQTDSTFILSEGSSVNTIYDVLVKGVKLEDAIQGSKYPNLDYVPGSPSLDEVDSWTDVGSLREHFKEVGEYYDYLVIDTSPYFNYKVKLPLEISDLVIIPVLLDLFSSKGLQRVVGRFDQHNNVGGKVLVAPVQVIHNSKLHRNVLKQLEGYVSNRNEVSVAKNKINYSVDISNTLAEKKLIVLESRFSKVGNQLKKLGKEVIDYV